MNQYDRTVENRLSDAIGTGELINIIYHGGSEPGASRFIQPIQLKPDKIRAKCLKTNRIKEFWIDQITLADGDNQNYTGTRKTADLDTLAGITCIQDIIDRYKDELDVPGYHLAHDDKGILLFKYGKSGKPLKQPVAVLCKVEGYEQKAWYATGGSFKYLSKAAESFMNAARFAITRS